MTEPENSARIRVPLVDLRAQYRAVKDEVREAIDRVCEAQSFILGAEVARFEAALAEFVGARFAVGVSSGSDALLCALLALELAPGDEVVTTPFTFVATAEAIMRSGATPRFVDIEPESMNLDPTAVRRACGPRTKVILPVHLFGHPAPLSEIAEIAAEHGLHVVEDAAQALGGRSGSRSLGAWGAMGCYSFFPSKPLGAFGDAGALVTDDAVLAERCRALRSHGSSDRVTYAYAGGNFRLDALQAAVLAVKLRYLSGWIAARRAHARAYADSLRGIAGLGLPAFDEDGAFANYTVRVTGGKRAALAEHLQNRGIQTAIHYPLPLHLQPRFAELGYGAGSCPESERAAREVLSLPLYPELGEEQRTQVIEAIRAFFASSAAVSR